MRQEDELTRAALRQPTGAHLAALTSREGSSRKAHPEMLSKVTDEQHSAVTLTQLRWQAPMRRLKLVLQSVGTAARGNVGGTAARKCWYGKRSQGAERERSDLRQHGAWKDDGHFGPQACQGPSHEAVHLRAHTHK